MKKERQELYKLEEEIVEKEADFYYSIVKTGTDDYLKYVISKRIHSFRHGLYPTNKKIILHEIGENWEKFFFKNSNYKSRLFRYF